MEMKELLAQVLGAIANWCMTTGIRVLIALILLFISFRIITLIGRRIERAGDNKKIDKTIARVLSYAFRVGLKVVVAVSLIGYVGIDTSGIAALIASLGVCAGLAVNGALSNLAGGVLLILTRPFRVDDYIEAEGQSGTVEDIRITFTRLRTPDNRIVYLPNGKLSAASIINYSEKDTRRVDLSFSVAYSSDFEKAKAVALAACKAHGLVLASPEPLVRISAHGDSALTLLVRPYVKSEDYWTVYFDLTETIKSEFDKAGIEIPFPQMDVHLKNEENRGE